MNYPEVEVNTEYADTDVHIGIIYIYTHFYTPISVRIVGSVISTADI